MATTKTWKNISHTLLAKASIPYTIPNTKSWFLRLQNTLTFKSTMELAWIIHDSRKSFIHPNHFVNQLTHKPHLYFNTLIEAHTGAWTLYTKNQFMGSYCALPDRSLCIKARPSFTQNLGLGYKQSLPSIWILIISLIACLHHYGLSQQVKQGLAKTWHNTITKRPTMKEERYPYDYNTLINE